MTSPARRLDAAALAVVLGAWRDSTGPKIPAYLGLADRLRQAILDGRVPLETRLPAEREVAAALGVSRTTVTAAYAWLGDSGFLRSIRGAGSWTDLPTAGIAAVGSSAPAALDGTGLIDMSHAAPAPPAAALQAAGQRALTELTRYLGMLGYDPLGLPTLRAAVARRFLERGLPTSPEEILVTSGAQQAFSLLLRTLTVPGDRVLVEHPTYPNALEAIQRAGCRPIPIAVGTDPDALEAVIQRTAPRLAYLIPDFQNPTGTYLDAEGRAALVRLTIRTGTPVVIDETIAELALDVPVLPPVASYGEGTIMTTGSLSKTFWGGLRIGWLRAAPSTVRQVAATRASFDLASPLLDQLLAVELVPQTADVVAAQIPELRDRRDRLRAGLAARLPHWRPNLPPGGLSLWVDLGGPHSSALAAAAEQHGVALTPGPRFGLDGAFERYVRLPYTLDGPTLDEVVERLAAASESIAAGEVPSQPAERGMA